jgi:hypothetical protein
VEQVRILSRCLRCAHVQEFSIEDDGVYGICVNKQCQYKELIVHGWKLYSRSD